MSNESCGATVDQHFLDVDQIMLDPAVQARESSDQETIAEYAEAWSRGAIFPPVHVFFDGIVYRLVDGVHRFLAAQQAGIKQISAIVHEGSARDAFLFAAKCNCDHGRRRTNGDKRYLVTRFLQDPEWGQYSARWIADACLVSHTFVQNMKAELATVASSERVAGRDGKLRPATMPRIPPCGVAFRRLDNISVEQRRELCTLWWDQLAKYVVLFNAAGWAPQRIADFLGMSVEEDILPILKPCPPIREVAEFKDISDKPEMLATAYHEVVDHIIHFLLGNCYRMAGSCAADDEGFSELKTALAECERYHGDKVKKLRQFVCPLAHAEAHWPKVTFVQNCASMDARFALGIEKNPDLIRQTKQPLAERFQDHLRQMDTDGLAT